MQVKSIQYVEFENRPKEWRLKGFSPEKINLIVGKNATGKSRTLRLIREFGNMLAGDRKLQWESGDYKGRFEDENEEILYSLKYEGGKVVKERLKIGEEEMLKRGKEGKGKIFATRVGKRGQEINFQVPQDELACVSKRDKLQHPFLEPLYLWGKSLRYYTFGETMGQRELAVVCEGDFKGQLNLKETEHVVMIFKKGVEKYPRKFAQVIKRDMAAIGYGLEDIKIAALGRALVGGVPSPAMGVAVKEKDLRCEVNQANISQGMFRALSLIIQLNYSELFSVPSCVLIDDIGEGLDYDRSKALIKLLIEKANKSGAQLIMTTNDRFVMNNVPLENWSIMQRFSGGAKVYNYKNARKVFEKFEFTGLSNFDFFSSGFYEKEHGGK